MTTPLMRAILALILYNRQNNAGLKVTAQKLGDVRVDEASELLNISFFAQSYRNELTGEKLISYRGTDTELPQSFLDFFN